MKERPSPYELLQFYVDCGADEAMGTESWDKLAIKEKILPLPISSSARPVASPSLPDLPPVLGTIEALEEAKELAAAADSIDALRAALEKFKGLALQRTATHMVFADGNPAARLMVIGEIPGDAEDRLGRPFVGENGRLLDKMLAAIGLSRDEHVYISHLLHWRPPGNRPPSEAEIALSLPFIRRHIELAKPSVLVLLGGMATKTLLDNGQSILKLRGKWLEYTSAGLKQPIPVLPIFNPEYLRNSPQQKGLAWADLLHLKAKLQELGIITP